MNGSMLIVKKIGCPYCNDFERNVEPHLSKMTPYESVWIGPSDREKRWFGKIRCTVFPCIIFENKSNGSVREFPRPRGSGMQQANAIVEEMRSFEIQPVESLPTQWRNRTAFTETG